MAPRPRLPRFFVPLSVAVSFSALALAAIGASGLSCGDARLYPLQFPVTDGGAGTAGGRGGGGGGGSGGATDANVDATDDGDSSIVPITCPKTAVVGFATLTSSGADGGPPQMGTNGGGALQATTVKTLDAFTTLVGDKTPRVILVSGIIPFPPLDGGTTGMQVKVGSNKTIVGADANSGFSGGGLFIDGSSNVIVRNLKISGAVHTDAITVQYSTNVWIDHCDLSCDPADPTACDGLVDIVHASDLVTVSWTYYHDHNASGLVGHSDNNAAEDTNHLTVTYHHDLFSKVFSGPRVRFGTVHLFNVDFEHLGGYAVGSTMSASVYVEQSVFDDIPMPITTMVTTSAPGFVAEGSGDHANAYLPPTSPANNNITTSASLQPPQYAYTTALTSINDVQTVVQACAGTGKVPPLPVP